MPKLPTSGKPHPNETEIVFRQSPERHVKGNSKSTYPGAGRLRLGDRLPVRPDGLRPRAVRDGHGRRDAPRTLVLRWREVIDADSTSWALYRPGRLRPGALGGAGGSAHIGRSKPPGRTGRD